jgi:hypothetical protein
VPSVRLQLPASRLHASATTNTLGQSITAVTIGPTQLGGLFLPPFRTPRDYDQSRPARLYLGIFNPSGAAHAAGDLAIRTTLDLATPDVGLSPDDWTENYAIEANWVPQRYRAIEITNAGEPALPARYLSNFSVLGIRIARNGTDPTDTWPGTLGIITTAWIDYTQECRYGCL